MELSIEAKLRKLNFWLFGRPKEAPDLKILI